MKLPHQFHFLHANILHTWYYAVRIDFTTRLGCPALAWSLFVFVKR